jgi:hypothetical protein
MKARPQPLQGAATVEARGNAHLSNEQASRIGDTLWTTASPAQTSVNIDVNVGEPLPGNVELMPLPPAVVSIVPEYRDYDYVVVHDEIVIVEPSTRKVVEVIQRGGETHAMRERAEEIPACFLQATRGPDEGTLLKRAHEIERRGIAPLQVLERERDRLRAHASQDFKRRTRRAAVLAAPLA